MEIYLPTDANLPHSADQLYDIPSFGNVSLLHFTDCHAQLLPIYYRKPSINLGVGSTAGRVPHLVSNALLHCFGIAPDSRGGVGIHTSRFFVRPRIISEKSAGSRISLR